METDVGKICMITEFLSPHVVPRTCLYNPAVSSYMHQNTYFLVRSFIHYSRTEYTYGEEEVAGSSSWEEGGNYNTQIEIGSSTREMLFMLFKSYSGKRDNSDKFWVPLQGKMLKLSRKQDDIYSELAADTSNLLQFPDVFPTLRASNLR